MIETCGECEFWEWFETNPELEEYELGRCPYQDITCIGDSCRFWKPKDKEKK